jgi:uncharacterized protein
VSTEPVPLVDHHCHEVEAGELDRPAFELLINEGFDPPAPGTSHFESPIGLAVRRWCGPALDLDPLAPADDYVARRSELGAEEVNRRLLAGAGLEALLLDLGYRPEAPLPPTAMGAMAGGRWFEVVRLEKVAEAVAAGGVEADEYPDELARSLEDAAAGAVGFKSIVAYRGGFEFDPSPPDRDEVVRAAASWLGRAGSGRLRLEDPVLLRHGIWTGVELARQRGFPIQFHSGFGDPDLRLRLADPSLLTDLVLELRGLGVNVVFLHCYPYHREAAYLAGVLPNVYFDVGPMLNYTGPSATSVLAEALELAPFTRHLYSSDAFGLAELHYLGAVLFRRALGRVLDGWIDEEECSPRDAERIVRLLSRENARRIYPLDGSDRGPG